MRQQLSAPTYLRSKQFIARELSAALAGERRESCERRGDALRNSPGTQNRRGRPGRRGSFVFLESVHYSAKTAGWRDVKWSRVPAILFTARLRNGPWPAMRVSSRLSGYFLMIPSRRFYFLLHLGLFAQRRIRPCQRPIPVFFSPRKSAAA